MLDCYVALAIVTALPSTRFHVAMKSLSLLSLLALFSSTASAAVVEVTNAGNVFVPEDITIDVGDTVRWTWGGGFHTVTEGTDGSLDGDEAFHSDLSAGTPLYEVVFDAAFLAANPRPGNVYDYFCLPHFSIGMVGTVTVNTDPEPGTAYCFGDPGSGTPCPCSNDNDGSVPGSGCANGVFASGAKLTASGTASLGSDTLVLSTTGLEPSNSGLYFQANNDLSPGSVWGDGLRCAGGQLRRLQIRFADASGASATTIAIAAKAGNINAGDTKRYQCWYRTTQAPPCGPGVNDFNASNGYEITWSL